MSNSTQTATPPFGTPHGLGYDWVNMTAGEDFNAGAQYVVDIHLRIELKDGARLKEFKDKVSEAQQQGDKKMPKAKKVLREELERTGRDNEANIAVVDAIILNPASLAKKGDSA